MKHLKLISFAVLVACCVFHVGGFPAQPEEAESSVEAPAYLEYAKDLAARGAELLGSGLYSGAETVRNELRTKYGDQWMENAARAFASGLYTGAGILGTGLKAGAGKINEELSSKYGENWKLKATRAVGSGLYTGAGMIGTGIKVGAGKVNEELSSKYGKDWKLKATRAVGSGLYTGAGVVGQRLISGAGMVSHEITNRYGDKFFTMNYETVSGFLEKLVLAVPSLRKTVDGFKTVIYVTNKIQKLHAEGKPIEPMALMKEAVDIYFMDVDPAFKAKLIDLSPLISDAALGDKKAAWKVTTALADRNTLVQALNGLGFKGTVTIFKTLIGQSSSTNQNPADESQKK